MKEQDEIYKPDKELNLFAKIINEMNKRNWEQACRLYIESNFSVIDLIHINNDALSGYVSYMDEQTNKYDILPHTENYYQFALLVEKSINLKNKDNETNN